MRNILNPPTPRWVRDGVAAAWRRQPTDGLVYWGPIKDFVSAEWIHDAAAWRMSPVDAMLPFERRHVHDTGRTPPVPVTKRGKREAAKALSLADLGL